MDIREAVLADWPALCALAEEVHRLHWQHLPDRFQPVDGPVLGQDYFQSLLADENVALLVAEHDGELVGFINVSVRDALDIPIIVPRRYAHIGDLAVRHDHRRAGIGRALMARAHEWARAKGATAVELNVYGFNEPARAFYRALGYEIVSCRMGRRL